MAENPLPPVTPENPAAPNHRPLMGYGSPEELVAAKAASDAEAKRLHQRIQELERQTQDLQQRQVPQPTNAWAELEGVGVPAQHLKQAIHEGLQEALGPWTRAAQAREVVFRRNPEFQKFEPEVNRWLSENPELNERYQRDLVTAPETAMEWAYDRFSLSKRAQGLPPPVADDPSRAAIPSSQAQLSRGPDSQMPSKEEFEKAIAYGRQFGDWGPFMTLRSKGTSIERSGTS